MPSGIPEGSVEQRRTRTFDIETVPNALTHDHETAPSVWGRLVVRQGEVQLIFRDDRSAPVVVRRGEPAIIPPERKHRVHLSEDAQFFVELWRAPEGPEPNWDDD